MVVFLLALIVLILLLGAAAVKGLIRGILLYGVVGLLLVASYVILVNSVGRENAHLVHIGGVVSLVGLLAFGKWASAQEAKPLWQQKAERNRRERIAAGDDGTIGSALRRWERQREADAGVIEAVVPQPEPEDNVSVKQLSKEQRKELRSQYRLERPKG